MLALALLLSCATTSSTGPAPEAAASSAQAPAPGVAAKKSEVPPVPGAVPPPGAPAAPPLAGTTDALLLDGLSRTSLTFTVGADVSPLALVKPESAAVYAAHLEAHPYFRVTRWEGATIAFLRVQDQRLGWTLPWAGYHQGLQQGQPVQWRAGLRLRPRSPGAEWTDSPLVDRFEPDDSVLKVHAFQPSGVGSYDARAAAIEVRAQELALELHELSRALELEPTTAAIKKVTIDLLDFDKFWQDADLSQEPWGFLPPGEPTRDEKGLYVVPTDAGIDVRGRLNPGAAGWTWVRLTDAWGYPWLEDQVGASTLERIGWSPDPEHSFWFQGRIPTDLELPQGAIVEAWFLADGDKTPRQVGRWSVAP